ncbi:MAG TPA: VWA domain-containing protein [Kofleriaceae bacterium]|nr:VWA domain-containing protein [Kofleriaceae bacterium]
MFARANRSCRRSSRSAYALLSLAALAGCGGGLYASSPQRMALYRPMPSVAPASPPEGMSVEEYEHRADNPELQVAQAPLSTFSIDVDTASLSNVRRFLRDGALPPADAVRIEEMVNYYRYAYREPTGDDPVAVTTEVAPSPFHQGRLIARVGIKGRDVAAADLPPRNLVFLVDTSGSMDEPNKLPLLQQSLAMLADQLGPRDHVAIVAYAGSAGVMLPPTSGDDRGAIRNALSGLEAGGSTNGAGGIQLAYDLARKSFDPHGINRVILCTDGDFNVGVTDQGSLVRLIEDERRSGVYLTVLGFGMGNLKDSTMEKLAAHGNGNYGYIDSLDEAKKSLGTESAGTLVTLAKDVKVQVEFNPAQVASYRLIGYENRLLHDQDFTDDSKDAAELGVGQTVTALYELTPVDTAAAMAGALKYQTGRALTPAAVTDELLTVRVRYKRPAEETSRELAAVAKPGPARLDEASADLRFAAGVAGFGMLLRDSEYKGELTWAGARALAESGAGEDPRRAELVQMIDAATRLAGGDQAVSAVAR